VQGEEAGESCAADDGAAEQQMDQRRADEGDAAEDGSADAEAPVGILIEAHDLAGEGHAERESNRPTPMIQVSSRGICTRRRGRPGSCG
jgi:hypothetical protein